MSEDQSEVVRSLALLDIGASSSGPGSVAASAISNAINQFVSASSGSSLSLHLFKPQHDATITPPSGVTLIGDHQADGDTFILDGTSTAPGDLPVLLFLPGSTNNLQSIEVGMPNTYLPGATRYGAVDLSPAANVRVTHGLSISNGDLTVNAPLGGTLTLDGSSTLASNATLTVNSVLHQGALQLENGATLTLAALGPAHLNLDSARLIGSGTVVNQGEESYTQVGTVGRDVSFQVLGGTLDIDQPKAFAGTIGPINGGSGPSIGIFGQVDVFQTPNAAYATFDTSTRFLDIFNGSGQDMAHLHFGGNASAISLHQLSGNSYVSINDSGFPVTGGLPITFT